MKKHQQQKVLNSIVVFFAVLIALAGGLLIYDRYFSRHTLSLSTTPAAPTALPTSSELLDQHNWISYQDEEYGFSFNYPQGFVQNVFEEQDQSIDVFDGITLGRMKMPQQTLYQADFAKLGYVIAVRVYHAEDFKELTAEIEKDKHPERFSKKETLNGNKKVVKYEGVGDSRDQSKVVFTDKNQFIVFTFSPYQADDALINEGKQIFNQIVGSVRF